MKWINENGEFYDGGSIVIGGTRYLSPSEDILAQAGFFPYVPPEPTAEELLELARGAKLAQIDERDQSDAVNVFYLGGQPMWLDAQTRQTLRISIESYQAMGIEQVTKWFGGQQFTFPTSAWLAMLNALEVYAAEALNATESHRAAVRALDTVEDIEAYDITTGYPEPLDLTMQWLSQQS